GRMREQDAELVAAKACYDVASPNPGDQQLRDLDQGFVPGLVAEAVVDQLQAVEVDEQHRPALAIAAGAIDEPLQRPHEASPVRQVDQRILMRELVELLDARLQLRDLPAQPAD